MVRITREPVWRKAGNDDEKAARAKLFASLIVIQLIAFAFVQTLCPQTAPCTHGTLTVVYVLAGIADAGIGLWVYSSTVWLISFLLWFMLTRIAFLWVGSLVAARFTQLSFPGRGDESLAMAVLTEAMTMCVSWAILWVGEKLYRS